MAHQRYHRVPYVLGASLNTTAATDRFNEAQFRNDTAYPFEVYALGFDLANAVSSPADQGYRDVGIHIQDQSRNTPWTKGGNYPRVATLVDLVSNIHTGASGQDLQAFNGTRWSLRYPTIIPGRSKLGVSLRNYIAPTGVNLTVAVQGALIVPARPGLELDAVAHWDRAAAWSGLGRNNLNQSIGPMMGRSWIPGSGPRSSEELAKQRNGAILAYERVPFVMASSQSEADGVPTIFPESDFRNDTDYDVHIYEVGMSLAGAEANYATQNMHDVSLRVVDVLRNREWSKSQIRAASLIYSNSSRMRIGQGTTWHSTKWDLGPGTVLPPGGNLRAFMQNMDTALGSQTLDLSFIGDMLIPIVAGTPHAEAFIQALNAVPTWA